VEGGGCKAIRGDFGAGYLLLLDKVDIRSIQTNGRRPRKIVRDLAQSYAFDYHLRHKLIIWTELTYAGSVIKRAFFNGSDVDVIIDTQLNDPHGIAVDWISDKIYWTDAARAHVSVADLSGTNRTVLFSDDMKKPRGIALDPTTGYMYWTDWGSSPRIERASMDGKSRMVLHSKNIVWPNALTVDYTTQCLYWIDANLDYIESSFMDGSRRTILYRELNLHFRPYGLTYFNDYLYMADVDARIIRSFDVRNGSQLEEIYSQVVEPTSVVAVHPTRQPHVRMVCVPKGGDFSCDCENITVPVVNPCEVDNGGCEYLCLLSAEGKYSCACPTGHRLHPNGRNCLGLDKFLLITDNKELYIVSLDVPHPVNVRVPLEDTEVLSGVAWDSRTDTVYFSDRNLRTINSAKITGEDQRVLISSAALGIPVGLAVDWLHDRLYWTDSQFETIESSDLDGRRRTVVVFTGLDKPRDIVLDPERGLMFWSDWGDRPKIMRSGLDGSFKTQLVTDVDVNVNYPNGLAIDYERQVLYWVDTNEDAVGMVHYNGSNPQLLLDLDYDVQPAGLDTCGDWGYWTNWKDRTLVKGNLSDLVGTYEVMIGGLGQPREVKVFHRNRNYSATTPCSVNNGRCSDVCVAQGKRSGAVKASCMCPVGYPLLDDGRTCASVINATLLFSTGNAIHQVSQDIDLYTADTVTPVPGASKTIKAVALDPANNILYYSSSASYGVHSLNVSDGTETVILNQHPTDIVSLEVDVSSQNLYFVDAYERRVEVTTIDGSRRRVLHNGLVKPAGLAMDPVSLSLFYIDSGDHARNEDPKIYTSAMDGSSQTIILEGQSDGLIDPLYIAVDNNGVNGRIFWTDRAHNHIMTATFVGDDARTILAFGPGDAPSFVYGIAYYNQHIYFTDPGNRDIYRSDLNGDKSVYLGSYDYLSDLKVVQPLKGHIRGCSNASRCDYLCLPNPYVASKQTCKCATGIEEAADGSCPNAPDTFLLVAAQNSLRQIALDNADGDYVDITLYDASANFEVNAVDYFLTAPGEGYVYFAEMNAPSNATGDTLWRSRIRRHNLHFNGDAKTLLTVVGIIEDIAVDWTTGNVYFTVNTMSTDSYIAVIDKDGHHRTTLVTGIGKPRGIALHPVLNTMFWTDFGDNAKIESARMDGTRGMSIVSRNSEPFTNLLHPNDVVIDLNTDIVYFSDGSAGIIGAVTLSGSGGRIVVNQLQDNPQLRRSQPTTSYIRKPRSLSIRHLAEDDQDGDDNTEEAELFWTDPEFKTLTATDLVTSGRTTNGIRKFNLRSMLPRTTPYKPFAVQFVSLNGHKVGEITGLSTTPCSVDFCGSLCVNVNSTHFQCLCPDSAGPADCRTLTFAKPTEPTEPSTETPTTITSSNDPTTAQETNSTSTTSEMSSSPSTDSGGRTTPRTGSTVSERSNEKDEEKVVKDVGIGLGTIVSLVLISFVAFVIFAVYFVRRSRNKYHHEVTQERYRDTHPPLRSLASSPIPLTPLKSNSFHLPNKQSNVTPNNVPAHVMNTQFQQAVNPSPSVNEFVEEPEVYELGPVRPRKPKRLSTPPDSPYLKLQKPAVCDIEADVTCIPSSANATVECTDEKKEESIEPPPDQKPTRSCLSSVSDSSLKSKPRTVSFVEVPADEDGDSGSLPPPPLPPKSQHVIQSSGSFSCEDPPPRPPKPALLVNDSGKEMSQSDLKPEDRVEKLPDAMNVTVDDKMSEESNFDPEECDAVENKEETVRHEESSGSGDSPVCKSSDLDRQNSETSSGDSLRSSDETRPILNSHT
jgi:sugar lactone lactonase YvrE